MNTYDASEALVQQHRAQLVAGAQRHRMVRLARRRRSIALDGVESPGWSRRLPWVGRTQFSPTRAECELG